jgi:hypothetical protein
MKLSDYTMAVLKNFSTINDGVVFVPGNVQRTISEEKSVMAEAELEESFPNKFGIYDLNQFIGNISTLATPDLAFDDKKVVAKDGMFELTYYSVSPELVKTPPEGKSLTIDNPDVTFDLPNMVLTKLLRLASMNSLTHLSIIGKNGELRAVVHDRKNDTANQASNKISDYSGKDFIATWNTDNLKMIADDYTVDVKLPLFARFTSKTKKLKYFISFESIK